MLTQLVIEPGTSQGDHVNQWASYSTTEVIVWLQFILTFTDRTMSVTLFFFSSSLEIQIFLKQPQRVILLGKRFISDANKSKLVGNKQSLLACSRSNKKIETILVMKLFFRILIAYIYFLFLQIMQCFQLIIHPIISTGGDGISQPDVMSKILQTNMF